MALPTTRDARRLASMVRTAVCAVAEEEALFRQAREAIWASNGMDGVVAELQINTSHRTIRPPDWERVLCEEIARTFEVGVEFVPGQCVRQRAVERPARGVVAFKGRALLADVAAATYVTLRQQMLRDWKAQDKRAVSANWRMKWVHRVAVHLMLLRRARNPPHDRNEHRHSAGNRR